MDTQLIKTNVSTDRNKLALGGYDPTSYWRGGPVKGNPAICTHHNGAVYHFASKANKARFLAAPGAFLPEYGGYCATAVSEGKIYPGDPTRYKITDDRLFLFCEDHGGDTRPTWEENELARSAAADRNWNNTLADLR